MISVCHSDLRVQQWQQDGSSGNVSRVLNYTIAINNPLGPKTARVMETQVSAHASVALVHNNSNNVDHCWSSFFM